MRGMATADLIYDPNDVGADLVVPCLVSHSPRATESSFDPQPGDLLLATDADEEAVPARVIHREGNLIWIQLEIPGLVTAAAPGRE